MSSSSIKDGLAARMALNQACFAPDLTLRAFVELCAAIDCRYLGLWSDRLDEMTSSEVRTLLADNGMMITALNRAGFFASDRTTNLRRTVDQTRFQIEHAASLGASQLIIVPGGLPEGSADLSGALSRVEAGLHAVVNDARSANVMLVLEPFHPALTANRGVVNRARDAIDLCRRVGPNCGVVLDVFHVWWDADIYRTISDGASVLAGYHLCDQMREPRDPVFDRGLPGEGVADCLSLTQAVLDAGYGGPLEMEVFSKFDLWKADPLRAAKRYRASYLSHIHDVLER